MYNIIFATENYDDCGEKWLCFYLKWKEVLDSSIEKMTKINLENFFRSPQVKNADFSKAVNNVKRIKEERENDIKRILEKSISMCPAKKNFNIYFLPVPFGDYVIMTNHSPKIGTFILYGVGQNYSDMDFKIFLPHEYAHVVRLQEILIPKGVDSPYKMTFGELAILEGLGVAFSMVFNENIDENKIPEYIGLPSPQHSYNWNKLISDFWRLQNKNFDELSDEELQRYYGENTKEIYFVGTYLILKLLSSGYSICSLNKMNMEEIIRIVKDIVHNTGESIKISNSEK